ncbi:hypothetical protein QC762_111240 [Podospora pseudocomata]|uniref:DUF3835 domain-containing protein n=1 Tax=Podospora pseudocomata TaxID=2093779 RepID=A0ABR0GUW7_9PEZI|nr:hypothetical protein QC762_111240 [Podospora pseudocomata]
MSSQPPKDHLTTLSTHITTLTQKVTQLRASLSHWQQWYLEYSSLKEEISLLPSTTPTPVESLRRIRRDFSGKVLTQKEINEIMGKTDFREVEQMLSLLTHRIDYVEGNINTVGKMLEQEENRLAAAEVVASPDVPRDEESGLPIMDIVEGVEEGKEKKEQEEKKATPKAVERKGEPKGGVADGESMVAKKTVTFAEGTKPGHAEREKLEKTFAQQQLEHVIKIAQESQAMDMSKAVVPEDEPEEDAKLRREMLEYSMSEIGPVVAELTLEEGEFSDDEDWDMDDEEEDDDEDDLGRSKHSVLSSDYIQRMQELEKKLGVKSAFSAPVQQERTVPDEGMGRISVVKESAPKAATKTPKEKAKAPKEKSVSFATELDIAPTTTTTRPDASAAPKINPVVDIVEKVTDLTMQDDEPEEPPKRVSRFKKERATGGLPPGPHQLPATFIHKAAAPPPEPTPPEDTTIAPTVVERPTPATAAEPDDMDEAMLYQAAAVEYNRMRNQLIQKQGGFIEDPPLNEDGIFNLLIITSDSKIRSRGAL